MKDPAKALERSFACTGCNFHPLGSNKSFFAAADQFRLWRRDVGRCQVFIFVWKDYSRAFISGGEWGYTWTAREMDELEIESLAERFQSAELQRVLELRR